MGYYHGNNSDRNHYGNRNHYDNRNYNNGNYNNNNHQSFSQKILRLLLACSTSFGFGLFWHSLIAGIDTATLYFVMGIILIGIGIIHVFLGIKKDVNYRKRIK